MGGQVHGRDGLKDGSKRRWSFLAGNQGNEQREDYGDGDHNRTLLERTLAARDAENRRSVD
jgi:hypothetical protein